MTKINKMIDHTLLKPQAICDQIVELCKQAKDNEFASVCVNSCWVKTCHEQLKGSGVKVCTVIGFPLGAASSAAKAAETHQALLDGADEFDMVINIGWLKAGSLNQVEADIASVVQAADGQTVKVIIETAMLTEQEKVTACKCAVAAKAAFVKTCTGFGGGGATVSDVKLMKETVGDKALVKASGGIHDYQQAKALIEAGASRLGTSSGLAIIASAPTNK